MPLSESGYMRRGRSANEDRQEVRRLYRRHRVDRAKKNAIKWAGRIMLVALGAVLTLLAQEFWPGITDDLIGGFKTHTHDVLGSLSTSDPTNLNHESPGSHDTVIPIPSTAATPAPTRPELAKIHRTPEAIPKPTPTIQYTKTSTPAPPQRATAEWISSVELEVHRLTNEERVRHSLRPLAYDPRLAAVARKHSQDMAELDFFAHENLRGQSPTDRADQAGYTCRKDYVSYYTIGIAENIFQTWLYSSYTTSLSSLVASREYMTMEEIASQVVTGWMNSPGHRQNILESTYDREGIGLSVAADEKVYVTQNFC
jgi:uncharacterized protein YkwD